MSSLVLTSYRLGLLCPNAITAVVPAKAGTQERLLDSCFRRNDGMGSTPIVQNIVAIAIRAMQASPTILTAGVLYFVELSGCFRMRQDPAWEAAVQLSEPV
jgi:hypothetical protein